MSKQKHYYYRTLRTSITGMQIQSLHNAIYEVNKAAADFAKQCGARAYENSTLVAHGGLAYLTFASKPDPKLWKYLKMEDGEALYIPKEKTLKGAEIRTKMNHLPVITGAQHNAAIGVDEPLALFAFVYCAGHVYISSENESPRKDLISVTEEEYNYVKNRTTTDC